MSRGFGFVRFREQQDCEQALRVMQGVFLGVKPMKVRPAQKNEAVQRESTAPTALTALCVPMPCSAAELGELLQRCGAFGAVKGHLVVSGRCLVEFQEPTAAEAAAAHLAGARELENGGRVEVLRGFSRRF